MKERTIEKKTKSPSALDTIIKDLLPESDDENEEMDLPLTSTSSSLILLCAESCQIRILFELLISVPSYFLFVDITSTTASTHHFTPADFDKKQILLSSSLITLMKEIFLSHFFFESSDKWKKFLTMMKFLDPVFYEESTQRLYSEYCCEQFHLHPPSSLPLGCDDVEGKIKEEEAPLEEDLWGTCERMVNLIETITSYLKTQHPSSGLSSSSSSSSDDRVKEMVLMISSVIVSLYALTTSLPSLGDFQPISSRLYQLILEIISSLSYEWSIHLIISISLLLENHPPTTPQERLIAQHQMTLLDRLSTFHSLPIATLRDNLLCNLIRPSFIFPFLLNILLRASHSLGEEGDDLTSHHTLISTQLFGLILGVALGDLDHLQKEILSKGRRSGLEIASSSSVSLSTSSSVENKLDEWMVLFPYLRILCWRIFGLSSPKNDTEECLNLFTNKLEVRLFVSISDSSLMSSPSIGML
jgi:hypothetical protein